MSKEPQVMEASPCGNLGRSGGAQTRSSVACLRVRKRPAWSPVKGTVAERGL